jgi:hypothetical protein
VKRGQTRKANERVAEVWAKKEFEWDGREESYWRRAEGGHVDARTRKAVARGLQGAVKVDAVGRDSVRKAKKAGKRQAKRWGRGGEAGRFQNEGSGT